MGRIGFAEILVVGVLILVVFGPQRLPEIARQVGRALGELRKVSSQFQQEVRGGFGLDDDGNFPYMYGPVKGPKGSATSRPAPPASTGSGSSVADENQPGSSEPAASGTPAAPDAANGASPAELPWAPWPGDRGGDGPQEPSPTDPR